MTIEITVKFSTVDFLGTDTDNILGYDLDKSVERYAEQLQADIQNEYPDATVEVEWTSDNMMGSKISVFDNDGDEDDVFAIEDTETAVERIETDLYGDFDRWLVEGFNTEAWTARISKRADGADTGDVLSIIVGEAGPMETQDAIVEIVVLDAWQGEHGIVAYRYSTASQDDYWQLGTVEQAVEHAAACYQTLNESDIDL